MKVTGNQKAVPMTLGRALDGKDLDLFAGTYQVPGVFTRNGWETSVKGTVGAMAEEYERGSWVLARPAMGIDPKKPGREAMAARLSEMYFADYAKEWSNFIRGIKIAAFKDRKDAAEPPRAADQEARFTDASSLQGDFSEYLGRTGRQGLRQS
jgi:type VI protein secretion system component VasK